MNRKNSALTIVIAAAMVVLTGCGGGGSGSQGGDATQDSIGISQTASAKLTPFKDEDLIVSPIGTIERSRISVLLADDADNAAFEAAVKAEGWQVMSFVKPPINAYSIDVKSSSLDNLLGALAKTKAMPDVVSVDVVSASMSQSISSNDTAYRTGEWMYTWNHQAIELNEAWSLVYSQPVVPEVNLGILDHGFDPSHEDRPVKEVIAGLGANSDKNHGMEVAGVMAAMGNNDRGIAGVTWANKGSNLYAIDLQRDTDAAESMAQLIQLLSRGVRVINYSQSRLGSDVEKNCENAWWEIWKDSPENCYSAEALNQGARSSLEWMKKIRTIVELHEKAMPGASVLFVQASGNAGTHEIMNTGAYPDSDMGGMWASAVSDSVNTDESLRAFFQQRTLIVGAFSQDTSTASKEIEPYTNKPRSNSGSYGFILAPGGSGDNGVEVYSTLNSARGYGFDAGTSLAAPHVSGVAGLILQANPNLTASQVRNIILDNSDTVDGYRSLNAYKAVQAAMALGTSSPIVEAITTKTYELNDSGKCYYESLPASKVAANEYVMTGSEWCLDSTGSQWVSGNGSNVPREILLPSGVWVSEADETFEITGDSTGSVKYGGVAMRAISLSKVSTGWEGTSVNGTFRYELFGDYSYSYVYYNTGSIDALIDTYNINSPNRGGWLSRGGQYAFLFGGSSSAASGVVHIFDPSNGPDWTGPDCATGHCQWTILATGTWTRATLGTSDVVTVSFPDPYKASFVTNGADDIIYVLKPGDTGVREGDHQLASHRENWTEFTRGAFDALLQSKGLPPTVN